MDFNSLDKLREWEFFLPRTHGIFKLIKINNINFTINTNTNIRENNNRSYLAVEAQGVSITLNIDNGNIIKYKGKFSKVQLGEACNWVCDNKHMIEKNWDEFIIGITISRHG